MPKKTSPYYQPPEKVEAPETKEAARTAAKVVADVVGEEFTAAEKKLDAQKKANASLKKENDDLKKAKSSLEKEVEDLKKANASLKRDLEGTTKQLNAANGTIKTVTAENERLKARIDEEVAKRTKLEAEKAELTVANEKLQKDLEDAVHTITARDEQIAELKAAHDNTSAALDASNAKVCELKAKMTPVQPACQVGTDASAKEKLKQYREMLSYLSSAEKKELLDCLSIKADCSDKVEEIIKGRDDIDLRLANQL